MVPLGLGWSGFRPQRMDANRPINTRERREAYTSTGWSQYDPASKGFTAEEIRQERERYMRR
jgi:hypothetical protein